MAHDLPKIYLVIGDKISIQLSEDKLKILTKTLEEANLSVRAINGLKKNFNCIYVGDIIFLNKSEFHKYKNIGKNTSEEIIKYIESNYLKFGELIEPWNDDVITEYRDFFEKKLYDNITETDVLLENELHSVIKQSLISIKNKSEEYIDRRVQIVIDRYGLDGTPSKTLEIIGQKYNVTRERIRQIEKKTIRHIINSKIPFPTLKKIYSIIQEKLPISEEELNLIIKKKNVTKIEWKIDGLRIFGDKIGFNKKIFFYKTINKKAFLINEKNLIDFSYIFSFVKKRISDTGLYSIKSLQELEIVKKNKFNENLLRSIVSSNLDFHWLDEEKNYFTFYRQRNRLSNLISKAITANKFLEIEKLFKSIKKNYRIKKKILFNINIFIEYCKINYDCIYNNNFTIEFKSEIPKLSDYKGYKGNRVAPNENKMINLFRNYGPIINWDDLKELALGNDISKHSLTMMIQFSPLFEKIDRATYMLQGTKLNEDKKDIVKIELSTRSFLKKDCPFEVNKNAYVEIYKHGKYQKTLAYKKPLRKIENNIYGVDFDDEVYPIKK